jgi:hypothetical protein
MWGDRELMYHHCNVTGTLKQIGRGVWPPTHERVLRKRKVDNPLDKPKGTRYHSTIWLNIHITSTLSSAR